VADAQTYVALDAGYIDQFQFEHLLDMADKCSRQISRFMTYLEKQR
jgi:regulator of RNase E activity RraB